jgi:hypothetical protein
MTISPGAKAFLGSGAAKEAFGAQAPRRRYRIRACGTQLKRSREVEREREQAGDRSSARAAALALRRMAQTARGAADWQRRVAVALHEVADAFVVEADGATDVNGVQSHLRDQAAHAASLAGAADDAARALDKQAAMAVSLAADADKRAGEA